MKNRRLEIFEEALYKQLTGLFASIHRLNDPDTNISARTVLLAFVAQEAVEGGCTREELLTWIGEDYDLYAKTFEEQLKTTAKTSNVVSLAGRRRTRKA